jgi:ketosteroid isomerase-like protein
MMRSAVRRAAALACAAALAAGCQAPPPPELTAADRAALAQNAEGWARAAEAGDMAALGSFYQEDAILMPPNHEVIRGREGIQAHFGAFPTLSDVRLEQIDVGGGPDWAYVRGSYSMTIHIPNVPIPASDRGKYIELWEKQADGSWKIARDIYNSDVAPAAP